MFAIDGDTEVGSGGDFIDGDFGRPRFHGGHGIRMGEEVAGSPAVARQFLFAFPGLDFGDAFRRERHAHVTPFAIGRENGQGFPAHDGFHGGRPVDQVAAELSARQFVLDQGAVKRLGMDGEAIEGDGFGEIDAQAAIGDAHVLVAHVDIEHGRGVAIKEILIRQRAGFHELLIEEFPAGFLHGGNFRWTGTGEAAEFKRVVIGGEEGGFVEPRPVGGDFRGRQIGQLAVPWLLEGDGFEFLDDGRFALHVFHHAVGTVGQRWLVAAGGRDQEQRGAEGIHGDLDRVFRGQHGAENFLVRMKQARFARFIVLEPDAFVEGDRIGDRLPC